MDLITLFNKGGLVMYPILLASIISVAIGIERFLYYQRAHTDMEVLEEKLPLPLQRHDSQKSSHLFIDEETINFLFCWQLYLIPILVNKTQKT